MWSVPKEAREAAERGTGRSRRCERPALADRVHAALTSAVARMPAAGAFSLTAAKRVVLPNGLTVILLEDHRLPVVVAAAEVAT